MGKRRTWEPTTRGDTAEIPLTRGHVAIIDLDDLPLVQGMAWQSLVSTSAVYALHSYRSPGGPMRQLHMHRLLCFGPGENDPRDVDHIDRDGLNNRRANLRPATRGQNMANRRKRAGTTSGYIGVNWHKGSGKWTARITVDGVRTSLGYYASEIEAARAVDEANVRMRGEFAVLNLPR